MDLLASAALEHGEERSAASEPALPERFRPLPGRVNMEFVPEAGHYICRMPGCAYVSKAGATPDVSSTHRKRYHKLSGRLHVYREAQPQDLEENRQRLKRLREKDAERHVKFRRKNQLPLTELQPAQPAMSDAVYCMYPVEVGTSAAGAGEGRLCGVKSFRLHMVGGEDVMVSGTLVEDGVEAVQDAVTCVAANLPALQRWLGRTGGGDNRMVGLWKRGEESLYVSLSEVREMASGRSIGAAALVSMVCMATGRRPDGSTAVTGDLDLRGNVRGVAGLPAKLEGCRAKDIRVVVVPRASYEGLDRAGWPPELREYADRAVRCVTHVSEVLQLAIEGCPRLPTSVAGPGLGFVGVGHSARFFASDALQAAPAPSFVVEVCQRQPGRGQLIITGHTPGPRMRANVVEARTWVMSRCVEIAVALGCTEGSRSSLASRLHNLRSDLHVHFQGGWEKMDWPLYGGAMAVAMVSFMTEKRPRPDVAVVGALTAVGQLLPHRVLKEQEVRWMGEQGFRTLVAPGSGIFKLPEAPKEQEMASCGVEMVSTEPHSNDFLPVLPRIFGLQA